MVVVMTYSVDEGTFVIDVVIDLDDDDWLLIYSGSKMRRLEMQ